MILQANALNIPLRDESVQMVCTSPPYWGLRDYGITGQLGLERTPEEYVANMVAVFREVRRVLREDGTCWLNLGDSYTGKINGPGTAKQASNTGSISAIGFLKKAEGLKPKHLVGIPWRVAFALQADGWYLRSDIIWAKPNPMPESVTDRPTKSHEYIFLLTKSAKYYFDQEAVREESQDVTNKRSVNPDGSEQIRKAWVDHKPRDQKSDLASWGSKYGSLVPAGGRNLRSVWTIATQPYPEAHFATFPEAIPKRCILAGTSAHGCCAKCGAPWRRVVERTAMVIKRTHNHPPELRTRTSGTMASSAMATTVGWSPACACNAPVAPCVVLDPFSGSGTTVAVAESLGRRGIGLELKPEYICMAKNRCQVTLGLPL